MYVRRFQDTDAQAVQYLIQRNLLEVNIKDYAYAEMKNLSKTFTLANILEFAKSSHTYVVYEKDILIGTGAISLYMGKERESILLRIFVLPEYQRKGIGNMILDVLEQDEYGKRAERIEVHASKTGVNLYEHRGYRYLHGKKECEPSGVYLMEKYNPSSDEKW